MIKTTHILLALIILTVVGCNNNSQKSEIKNERLELELVPEPDKYLREQYEQQQKDSSVKDTDCSQFSRAMIELKKLLEKDNYNVEIKKQQNDLWFKREKEKLEFGIDKTISIPKSQCLMIFAKRKNKLEQMQDNWYPSFSVTEICFQDENVASKTHKEISEIINNGDNFNEKNYDYILENGNRLIYVSCGAKIFEEYAFSYRDKIEELIMNNKPL